MATLPQFKQRQLARRSTSDIERLAKQYQSNVEALTGEYQTAFTGYQAGVAEKMKPFEAQMATYKESLLPTYEAQKATYQKQLDDYNAVLAEIEKNPVTARTERVVTGKTWYGKRSTVTSPSTSQKRSPSSPRQPRLCLLYRLHRRLKSLTRASLAPSVLPPKAHSSAKSVSAGRPRSVPCLAR